MPPKASHDAAKAKAAREKKILLALVVPLMAAVFFAYHTLNKLHHPASTTSPPVATTPASTVSTGTPVSATTPASTVAALATLPPDTGKLTRLTILTGKDPFHDQGPVVAAATSPNNGATQPQQTKKQAKQALPPPTSAVISVNGRLASVSIGAQFPVTNDPATNGIFRLVGLTRKSAKIAVAGGSYANGKNTLTLTVDSVVTLVNQADGKRFTLILYPQGTPVPGVTSSTTPASTTATTTTSTTTTPGS